eukprot:TRINITY_DN12915_c0_g1_i1.p1 TRINITY_DN12915_c0_g1~~TRINITY_DN12915_c0_g1_i1.p1  ORF type:complete len:288 (-),score=60.62 TRINITY_DN12915_c0_g1_i1:175-963(-)
MAHVANYSPAHNHMDSDASSSEGDLSTEDMKGQRVDANLPPSVRRSFIRKVYSILSMQLMLTVIVASPIAFVLGRVWVLQNMWLYYMSLACSLGIMCAATCCCSEMLRTFPANYAILFTFTFFEALLVGCVSAMYSPQAVIMAAGTTVFVFLGLTAYACFTKTDFTGMGPYLMAALMAMISFSFMCMMLSFFMDLPPWLHTAYAFCGVLLFSFYIVYDTQLIVGGKHKNAFSVDDYCYAALNLYLDIINLFLYLLSLFGDRS